MIEYKGYTGMFEYDPEIDAFVGRIPGIKGAITFQGKSTTELKEEMAKSVDEYLAFCEERGIEPAKPYSGRFNVRMEPEIHRAVAEAAAAAGESMNDFIVRVLTAETAVQLSGSAPKRTPRSGEPKSELIDLMHALRKSLEGDDRERPARRVATKARASRSGRSK